MDEHEVQKSCWGVTTWAVVVFLGVFAVVSFFADASVEKDAVASVNQQQ